MYNINKYQITIIIKIKENLLSRISGYFARFIRIKNTNNEGQLIEID